MDLRASYLDLLKRSLIDVIGNDVWAAMTPEPVDAESRMVGNDWPHNGLTMIGYTGLTNVQECVEDVLANDVPGDFIETGSWRGGATIFMRALLRLHGSDRQVWVADSFQGLPPPSPEYPADADLRLDQQPFLSVPLEKVKENFAKYGLLDDQVRFLEGWFKDTLPTIRDRQWAVVRLDGDLYESTILGLDNLYPGLSLGGYLIVDDYGAVEACRTAVHDYRTAHGITEKIRAVDGTRSYWQKA